MKPRHLAVFTLVVAAVGFIALSFNARDHDGEAPVSAVPGPPELELPSPFSLTNFVERHMGEEISVTGDVSSRYFSNCTLKLRGFSDVNVTG